MSLSNITSVHSECSCLPSYLNLHCYMLIHSRLFLWFYRIILVLVILGYRNVERSQTSLFVYVTKVFYFPQWINFVPCNISICRIIVLYLSIRIDNMYFSTVWRLYSLFNIQHYMAESQTLMLQLYMCVFARASNNRNHCLGCLEWHINFEDLTLLEWCAKQYGGYCLKAIWPKTLLIMISTF